MPTPIRWTNCILRLGDMKEWEDNPAEIDKESAERLAESFKPMYDYSKRDTAIYIWHAATTQQEFERAMNQAGYEVKQQLIWNKGMTLGRSDYHWAHELCFYGKKKDQTTTWYGDRRQRTVLGTRRSKLEELPREKMLQILLLIWDQTTNWEVDRDSVKEYRHSTQKPIRLAAKAMKNSAPPEGIILDPFAGSGSTMVACENLGFINRSIELDPKKVAVILQRMEDAFIGIKIGRVKNGKKA